MARAQAAPNGNDGAGSARMLGAVAGAALIVALCGCGSSAAPAPTGTSSAATTFASEAGRGWRGRPALAASRAQDFALRDQNGKVVRLSAQRGRLVLLTFLYTACPDVCPLIASNLNAAVRTLRPEERRQVRVIAVSVDPQRDTRPVVRAYVHDHHLLPQFRYLIGSHAELQPIWQAYNVLVDARDAEVTSHSTFVLLLDRGGTPRLYYTSHVSAADVFHDLRRLLSAA